MVLGKAMLRVARFVFCSSAPADMVMSGVNKAGRKSPANMDSWSRQDRRTHKRLDRGSSTSAGAF